MSEISLVGTVEYFFCTIGALFLILILVGYADLAIKLAKIAKLKIIWWRRSDVDEINTAMNEASSATIIAWQATLYFRAFILFGLFIWNAVR